MKRLLTAVVLGCIFHAPVATLQCAGGGAVMADGATADHEKKEPDVSAPRTAATIIVSGNGDTVVFELTTGNAAKDLYRQLPLSVSVENYSNNEKIFHPPEKLGIDATPPVDGAREGTLAYYAPWGNVVMFYDRFPSAPGLYELGYARSGAEYIKKLSGAIRIEKGTSDR